MKKIQRSLKNNSPLDKKLLRELRAAQLLDRILTVSDTMDDDTERMTLTLLMYYVKQNDLLKVKELLTGVDPASTTVINNKQWNALAIAVCAACNPINNDLAIIEELLKYNPEQQLLQKDNKGLIPLHTALEKDMFPLVKILLKYAAKEQLLIKTKEEDTAFVFAARSENNKMIAWLVSEYPFILNERATDGFTPLHIACKFSSKILVWFLLQKGPKDQEITPDSGGIIPLHQACIEKNTDIIKELLKSNPAKQLTYEDKMGNTIFHTVCAFNEMNILKLLIEYAEQQSVDLEAIGCKKNRLGITPLQVLATRFSTENSINIMRRLLINGGKKQLELQDPSQDTLLLNATNNKDIELVKELVKYDCPAQFVLQNKEQKNPLICAIDKECLPIIKILLKSGPSEQLSIQLAGVDLLSYAVLFKKDIKIVELLLEYSTKEQVVHEHSQALSLHSAIRFNMMGHFDLIMQSKFSRFLVNLIEKDTGTIPLHTAVDEKHYGATSTLLEAGSDVNLPDFKGWTPMHVACKVGDLPLLGLLTSYGGNIYLKTLAGLSTLDVAIAYGNLSIVEELLTKHNIIANIGEPLGKIILLAIARGQKDIIHFLLTHGVNINTFVEYNGKSISPFLFAIQSANLELVQMLKNQGATLQQKINPAGTATLYDFIINKYRGKAEIYGKIRGIFPELPEIKVPAEQPKIETLPSYQATIAPHHCIKPREYLLSIGYPQELIDRFESERKINKSKLKASNKIIPLISEKKPEEVVEFLDGKINSTHEAIKKIEGNEQSYCYLDSETLLAQGCDLEQIKNIRLKFDGQHIKKLDNDKGEYYDLIQLSPDADPVRRKYTHELKVNQLDRIFLIQEGPLFIGIKYVSEGLHRLGDIHALNSSTKSNTGIEVQWPPDIVFQHKNKRKFQ